MSDSLTGRCLCGSVRYRAPLPISPPTLCHCESCRRATGAHVVAWVTVANEALEFTAGSPVIYESSPQVRRGFCGSCGTPLTYWTKKRPGDIDLTVASLDRPDAVVPIDHVWMSDALAWDKPRDGLPGYQHSREGDPS